MPHITGTPRQQLTLMPEAIEDYVDPENPVRFLDAYIDLLDMDKLGFVHARPASTGRPSYDPKDLLKLYLYGYLNRIRSSRCLERESIRNLEVIWLLKRLRPDHWTINEFRKNHGKALRGVFRDFVSQCKAMDLFGAQLVGIDSSKFTACNARDRILDAKGLAKSLQGIADSIEAWMQVLDQNDAAEQPPAGSSPGELTPQQIQDKIAALKAQQQRLEQASEQLAESGEKTVSLSDPDCRLMKNRGRIEPAYSIHTAVDAKNHLIVDYQISQQAGDANHLSSLALVAKQALHQEKANPEDSLQVCADAGYYDSVDLKACQDQQITTYVPIPKHKVSKKTNVPKPPFYPERFLYDADSDTYRCPQGQLMHYFRTITKADGRRIRIYRTPACQSCPLKGECTTSKRGRYIYRWEHQQVIERLAERLTDNPQMSSLRKTLVEHPFGTLKGAWGYRNFLLRGKKKVETETGLMLLAYNIRRALNVLGTEGLIAAISQPAAMPLS